MNKGKNQQNTIEMSKKHVILIYDCMQNRQFIDSGASTTPTFVLLWWLTKQTTDSVHMMRSSLGIPEHTRLESK